PADLAGDLAADPGIRDLAGVDELARRREELDPLQEERPLLREEEREPLVDRDLAGVGLDLAEVGVDRRTERDVREPDAEVHADVGLERLATELAARGDTLPVRRCGHERLGLEDDASPEVVQPLERPGLGEEARAREPGVGPSVDVSRALDPALDLEAPALRAGPGVAEALERDPDLDDVAVARQAALRLEPVVGAPIHRAAEAAARGARALGPDAVLLHAERVDREEEGATPVVEGVEIEDDVVIAADVVAVRDGRADLVRVAVAG